MHYEIDEDESKHLLSLDDYGLSPGGDRRVGPPPSGGGVKVAFDNVLSQRGSASPPRWTLCAEARKRDGAVVSRCQ